MKKNVFLLFLLTFALSGCEKDDICDSDTPTTPRLIIAFYDISNPSVPKKVTNLKVIGEGMAEGIIFNQNATGKDQYLANTTSIAIPLKTGEDFCTYSFILNYENSNQALTNQDNLKFTYSRSNEYISRACGYKTLYNFNLPKPIVQTDGPNKDGLWMQLVILEKSNIDNENEADIKVFF